MADAFTTPPDSAPGPPRTVRQKREDRKRDAVPLPLRLGAPSLETMLSDSSSDESVVASFEVQSENYATPLLDSEDEMLLSPKNCGPNFNHGKLPWWKLHVPLIKYNFTLIAEQENAEYLMDLFYQYLHFEKLCENPSPRKLHGLWAEFAANFNTDAAQFKDKIRNSYQAFMKSNPLMELHLLCQQSGAPCAVMVVKNGQQCPLCYEDDEEMTEHEMDALNSYSSIAAKIRELAATPM